MSTLPSFKWKNGMLWIGCITILSECKRIDFVRTEGLKVKSLTKFTAFYYWSGRYHWVQCYVQLT